MTRNGHLIGSLVVLFVLAAAPWAQSDEWPQFRGPNRDGKSAETGLLKKWPAGGPTKVWTARGCGGGYGSVSIAGGLIYTMGAVGQDMCVTAFDLNGARKWQEKIGLVSHPVYGRQAGGYGKYSGSRSTPTYDAGKLYVATPMGDVACLDAATGSPVWALNTFEKFGANNTRWGMAESPLVHGDRVIVQPGGPNAGVVALSKSDGSPVWKSAKIDQAPGYASLVVAVHNDRELLLVMSSQHAAGLDLQTGELLWKHYHKNQHDVNATNPIYYKGHVFITSGYRLGSVLLKLSEDGSSVSPVWENQALDNHHGGAIFLDDLVYSCSSNGKGEWICLDVLSGDVKFRERAELNKQTREYEKGFGKGSAVYADGMLYCFTEAGGRVGLVPATPKAFEVVSSFAMNQGAARVARVRSHLGLYSSGVRRSATPWPSVSTATRRSAKGR